jgi:hypothetical protein
MLHANKNRSVKLRKFTLLFAAFAALSISILIPESAEAGCYRWGLSGYHWFRSCLGPFDLYPHRKVCRHDHCWYEWGRGEELKPA